MEIAEKEFNAFLKRRGIQYYCSCGTFRGNFMKCPECEHFEEEFRKEKLAERIMKEVELKKDD